MDRVRYHERDECLPAYLHGAPAHASSVASGIGESVKVWWPKFLNNVIEQDRRHIKSGTNVTLGVKRLRSIIKSATTS
jgi:hypothetical protein